jgi:flagellar brake protein
MNSNSAAAPADGDEESRFRITSQAEILSELRDALAQHALLTVCYGNDREHALSTLLEVDAAEKTLTLDACQNAVGRKKMLAAHTLTLETEVRRIRIRFDSGRATAATHDGQHAIKIALPTVMLRIQRREAYRIETPLTEVVNCRFPLPTPEHREVMLRVADLSVKGMGLIADSRLRSAEQGSIINECRIDLPDTGVVHCDAQIVRVYETLRSGKQRFWIGCQFVRLPGTAGTLLQRYILELERARMARARGIKL